MCTGSEEQGETGKQVETYLGRELPFTEPPVIGAEKERAFWKFQRVKAETKPKKGEVLNEGITRLSVGGGRKSKMRAGDIVGTICSIEGMEASDIGIVDIRDSISYVEILNRKGDLYNGVLNTPNR